MGKVKLRNGITRIFTHYTNFNELHEYILLRTVNLFCFGQHDSS